MTAGLKRTWPPVPTRWTWKRGIDKAVEAIVANLKKQSKKVGDDNSKIEQVGTISANNDPEIGKLIAEAMAKVSKDGVITVEEAKGTDTCGCGGRYAVRPWLFVALLRNKCR